MYHKRRTRVTTQLKTALVGPMPPKIRTTQTEANQKTLPNAAKWHYQTPPIGTAKHQESQPVNTEGVLTENVITTESALLHPESLCYNATITGWYKKQGDQKHLRK